MQSDDPWMEGGGPAFPSTIEPEVDAEGKEMSNAATSYRGISVRDWFAGQALTGLLAANPDNVAAVWQAWAADAYAIADAMLERRKIKPEDVQP